MAQYPCDRTLPGLGRDSVCSLNAGLGCVLRGFPRKHPRRGPEVVPGLDVCSFARLSPLAADPRDCLVEDLSHRPLSLRHLASQMLEVSQREGSIRSDPTQGLDGFDPDL